MNLLTVNDCSREVAALKQQVEELKKDFAIIQNLLVNSKQELTMKEASVFLNMSQSTLYKLTSTREIPYYKPGGKMVYFDRSELEAWIRRYRYASVHEVDEEAQAILQKLAEKKPAIACN